MWSFSLVNRCSIGIEDARLARAFLLLPQKLLRLNPGLFENGSQRAFRHIAGMIWNGGVAVRGRVEPDFMAARRLAVELKAQQF